MHSRTPQCYRLPSRFSFTSLHDLSSHLAISIEIWQQWIFINWHWRIWAIYSTICSSIFFVSWEWRYWATGNCYIYSVQIWQNSAYSVTGKRRNAVFGEIIITHFYAALTSTHRTFAMHSHILWTLLLQCTEVYIHILNLSSRCVPMRHYLQPGWTFASWSLHWNSEK